MPLSASNWRLFVAPLAGVERQRCGTLGGGGAAVGIPDSLPLRSSTVLGSHPFSFVQPLVHRGSGSGSGSSFSGGERSSRASSSSSSRLLQPVVCCDESLRVVETSHRPFHSEPSSPQVSVQDGDSAVCASLCSERRLNSVSGLEGHILAISNSFRQPQVSQVRSHLTGVPVQGYVFWSLHGSAGFHEGHGSGIDLSSSCGDQDSSLP